MPYGSVLADVITSSDGVNSAGLYGFKNRIINGGMQIDQRNAGASVTPTNGQYLIDRYFAGLTQASKYSVQRTSTAPDGFINSLRVTSSSAYSVLTNDVFYISQAIEGLNCYDLAWGTASAVPVTLSFRVYSSLTGTFGGSITNSGASRSYPFTYSIPVANTWTTISVTIPGDTSGTWLTTNSVGIYVFLSLGTGATLSGTAGVWAGAAYYSATGAASVVGTSGATWFITGLQLERGSVATSFDYRPYGTELQLCQRYCYVIGGVTSASLANGSMYQTTSAYIPIPLPVQARVPPTGISVTGTYTLYANVTAYNVSSFAVGASSVSCCEIIGTVTGATGGQSTFLRVNTAGQIQFTGMEL